MTSFFSKLAKQITQVIAPPPDANEDEATRIWQAICNCTLDNTQDSLNTLHSLIQDLIEVVKMSSEQGTSKGVFEILTAHQIPSKLVAFAEADIPHGFINEVILFFIEFTFLPLSNYLREPFIINGLNRLLKNSQSCDPAKFGILIESILTYVNSYPDDIDKFVINDTSAPFLSELLKNISEKYSDIGEFIFPLLAQTKYNQDLHTFLVNSSPLIPNTVKFVKACVEHCAVNPKKRQFILFLDIALQSAPPDFVASFYSIFEEEVFDPLIMRAAPISSLKSAIYILTSFGCIHIIRPVMQFVQNHILEYLDSGKIGQIYLGIRCVSLIIEHSPPKFPQFADPDDSRRSKLKLFLDFISLLPPEWYVKQDMKENIENATSRVTLNHSAEATIMYASDWDIAPTLERTIKLFDNFLDNELILNLALTDFFALIAALPDQESSYFTLSGECEKGLVKSLQEVCLTAKRRIGKKEVTKANIEKAYENLGDASQLLLQSAKQKEKQENMTEIDLYQNIVALIEFSKELAAISQSKNLFHQRDEFFQI